MRQPGEDAGVHQPGVDVLKAKGVFEGTGCVDGSGGLCLSDPLPRWEMAVWLVRVHDDEEPRTVPSFVDVDSNLWWSAHTGRLAELGVTLGCKTQPLSFCPDGLVNRGQMAAFLARAFDLLDNTDIPTAGFTDIDENHIFADEINALAQAGITSGCDTEPLRYCPKQNVTRAQMATFLARALKLL